MLAKDGILDLAEEDRDFTQEDLNKFKQLHPEYLSYRHFKNFPKDEDTIKIVNTVAQNKQQTNQYNSTSYAKKGTKLIPRKKRLL